MIKKVDILGVQLDNYTVREAIMKVEGYLDNNVLNIIECITSQMLINLDTDEVTRNVISSLDLAVIGDKEIIQAAGLGSMQRIRETEENDFYFEFFKRVERNKKTVFLLGEKAERLKEMRTELNKEFPKLEIVGEYAIEDCVGNWEGVINDMNVLTPDVILSVLPNPLQENFLWEHRDKMNANIWYGIGNLSVHKKSHGIGAFLESMMQRGKLKNSINKYQVKNEE